MENIKQRVALYYNVSIEKVLVEEEQERENDNGILLKAGNPVYVIQGPDNDANFAGWIIGNRFYKQ